MAVIGNGFALAFALKPLVLPGILALPVVYEQSEQAKLLRELIESNVSTFEEIQRRCPVENLKALKLRAIQMTALGLWVLSHSASLCRRPAAVTPCRSSRTARGGQRSVTDPHPGGTNGHVQCHCQRQQPMLL